MADTMTPEQRHMTMSHIHSKDTKPEIVIRQTLFTLGYRYRLNVKNLPGSPDLVLHKYRTAIFVNGCFWHGHKGCSKYVMPKSNVGFWTEKIYRNQERDLVNIQRLESLAWNVITIWECELSKSRIDETIVRIVNELTANKEKWEQYQRKRRLDRVYAREQARRHREILAQVEAELKEQFHIPVRIRKESRIY